MIGWEDDNLERQFSEHGLLNNVQESSHNLRLRLSHKNG